MAVSSGQATCCAGQYKSSNGSATNSTNSDGNEPIRLKRNVSLLNGISIIIGVIVGSGIFISPKGLLVDTGSVGLALIVWLLSGIFALLGALCFAELGTSIPSSGGDYQYIQLAYGPLPSFLYLWVTFGAILPCSNAISALTFAQYLLEPFCKEPDEQAVRLLALCLLCFLTYINCASVKGSMRAQNCFTLAKVLALVTIIAYGMYYMFSGQALDQISLNEGKIWAGSDGRIAHLAQAFYFGFYTYAGWNSLNFVTEELKDPVRNMPRAIVISMILITLLYILTNLAYFAVLSKEEILASEAIAVVFGRRVLSSKLFLIMPISVALSTMGSLNGGIFAGSRVLLAGARQGQLMWVLKTITIDKKSPVASIIALGFLSSLYLVTTKILKLIHYLILVDASFLALAVSTVLVLRYKMPHLDRPLRVPTIIPIIYLAFSFLLIILPIWISPKEAFVGIIFMLAGIPLYYVTANWQNKPIWYQRFIDKINEIVQKLTLSVDPGASVEI